MITAVIVSSIVSTATAPFPQLFLSNSYSFDSFCSSTQAKQEAQAKQLQQKEQQLKETLAEKALAEKKAAEVPAKSQVDIAAENAG